MILVSTSDLPLCVRALLFVPSPEVPLLAIRPPRQFPTFCHILTNTDVIVQHVERNGRFVSISIELGEKKICYISYNSDTWFL